MQQAADAVHLKRQQIQQFETGYARPTVDTFLALCAFYGVERVDQIATVSDEPRPFYLRKTSSIVNQKA